MKKTNITTRPSLVNNKKGKVEVAGVLVVLFLAIIAGAALLGSLAYFGVIGAKSLSVTGDTGSKAVNVPENLDTQCVQNPAYTYSAIDAFAAGTTVTGTDQIKNNGDAPVSSLASPTGGAALVYWKSNVSYFCNTQTDNAACGSHTLQTQCYQNSTVTLALRDLDNDVSISNSATAGTTNLTMGANGVNNLELRYTGTAKAANMPFGGCVAIEYPSTVNSATLSGAGITGAKCPYTWTYTTSSTSNTYQMFEVPAGFDKDGAGELKRISLQLKASSSNPSGTGKITFQPANYYVGNDKQFYLGIEKDKNQDFTKTMPGGMAFNFAIA